MRELIEAIDDWLYEYLPRFMSITVFAYCDTLTLVDFTDASDRPIEVDLIEVRFFNLFGRPVLCQYEVIGEATIGDA